MSAVVLELQQFSIEVDGRALLLNVSLSVRKGEFVCIVGPNGAGKTTLLKCLNRIMQGGGGVIHLHGRSLSAYSQRLLARHLAYVPQAQGHNIPFTVYEFVMMGRYGYLNPWSSQRLEDDQIVRHALALTNTGVEFTHRRFNTLSGGEQQKVFLAAAIAQQADILLLDEPTTFLDPRHQADIHQILRQLHQEGKTILCTTHDLNSALRFATRIIGLRAGSVFFDGPAHALASNAVLSALYDHDFLILRHPQTGDPIALP